MIALSVDQVVARVERLPNASPALREVLQTTGGEAYDLDRLVAAISRDPALSARAMRIANSPFFGLSRRIDSVRQAAVVIGSTNLRSLVIAAALTEHFGVRSVAAEELAAFWHHCLSVALIAKTLAGLLGEHQDRAFAAGLLHDIGRLVLITQFSHEYRAVEERARVAGVGHYAAERDLLGIDHAAVGGLLAERWHLPGAIAAAIRCHARPVDEIQPRVVDTVAVAERLAYLNEAIPLAKRQTVPELESDTAWQRLGLSWGAVSGSLAAAAGVDPTAARALFG